MSHVQEPGPAPPPPENVTSSEDATPGDFAKLRYSQDLEAWLEKWKQEVSHTVTEAALEASRADTSKALEASRENADRAAEVALVKSLHDAYVAVIKSSVDRSLTRTNIATASIGAVTTIYTGLLALVYAAKPGGGKPLTVAAIIPALFLGLALFLVTIYAAMIRASSSERGALLPSGVGDPLVEYRLNTFMEWCFASVTARTWALHSGIVSLGWGIACLPVPFVSLTAKENFTILIAGLVLVGGTASFTAYRNKKLSN